MSKITNVLSGILRELRRALPQGTARTDATYQYVNQQFRQFQETPNKVCRSPKAAFHQASTYLCYLKSNRQLQETVDIYKGQGDRSIEESANLVGLKLPKVHVPEPTTS